MTMVQLSDTARHANGTLKNITRTSEETLMRKQYIDPWLNNYARLRDQTKGYLIEDYVADTFVFGFDPPYTPNKDIVIRRLRALSKFNTTTKPTAQQFTWITSYGKNLKRAIQIIKTPKVYGDSMREYVNVPLSNTSFEKERTDPDVKEAATEFMAIINDDTEEGEAPPQPPITTPSLKRKVSETDIVNACPLSPPRAVCDSPKLSMSTAVDITGIPPDIIISNFNTKRQKLDTAHKELNDKKQQLDDLRHAVKLFEENEMRDATNNVALVQKEYSGAVAVFKSYASTL